MCVCMFVCTCDQVGERRNSGYTSWRNVISFVPNKKNNIVKWRISLQFYPEFLFRVSELVWRRRDQKQSSEGRLGGSVG